MYLAKGTKVSIEGIRSNNIELSRETSYIKLVESVEDIYRHKKVTGFKFIDNKTIKLLTIDKKEEGDKMLIPIGTNVSFIADGELQVFKTEIDSTIDMIEETIFDWFEGYREESLCLDGKNVMFPNITTGYMIIEGRIGDTLEKEKKETYFSFKDVKKLMKLGIRKGDILHLKGVSSLRVSDVDYGDRMLAISFE